MTPAPFVLSEGNGRAETRGFYNALIVAADPALLEAGRESGTTRFTVATRFPERFAGAADAEVFRVVEAGRRPAGDKLYLPSLLLPDETIDAVTEHVLETGARVMVRACSDLVESGKIEARFHLSPVMLLHKLGLLDFCVIAGGEHLDRDDIDLLVQNDVPLVLTPTEAMGGGCGVPSLTSLIKRGLFPRLGTGLCAYNLRADMRRECAALLLAVRAEMSDPGAATEDLALSLASDEASRAIWQVEDKIAAGRQLLFGASSLIR